MNKKIIFIILLIAAEVTFAGNTCVLEKVPNGALDSIAAAFYSSTSAFQEKIVPAALKLFWFLFSLEFFYQIAIKKVLANDINKLWRFAFTRIFVAGFLAEIFLKMDIYIGIIGYFTKLGLTLTHISSEVGPTIASSALSPSSVMGFLFCTFNGIFSLITGVVTGGSAAAVVAVGWISTSAGTTLGTFMAFFVAGLLFAYFACILLISIVLLLTTIQAYVVLFAGFILAGFAGSSWTINYWQRYLGYVGGVAIRLFMTSVIMGVIVNQAQNPAILGFNITDPDFFKNLVFGSAVLFFDAVLLWIIPSQAASLLNGQINANLGEMLGATATILSGGKMIANPVVGSSIAAGQAAKTIYDAKNIKNSSIMREAKNSLTNSNGSSGGNGPDNWKDLTQQMGKDAAASVKDEGFKKARKTAATGFSNAKSSWSDLSRHASSGSGAAGGTPLNIDPHKNH